MTYLRLVLFAGLLMLSLVATAHMDGKVLAATDTPTPAPPATATSTLTPVPSSPTPTPIDPLALYADMTRAATNSIETVKWVAITVLTMAGLLTAGIGAFTIYSAGVARHDANEATALAAGAKALVEDAKRDAAEARTRAVELSIDTTRIQASVLAAKESVQEAVAKGTAAEERATILRAQLDQVDASLTSQKEGIRELQLALGALDAEKVRILATLSMIDQYWKALLSTDDPRKREQATWALLEKTKSESPLVRRESVAALASTEPLDGNVVEQLQLLLSTERDLAIRDLIQGALRRWGTNNGQPAEQS